MIFTINTDCLKKQGFSVQEALGILLIKTGANIHELFNHLEASEKIVRTSVSGSYLIPHKTNNDLEEALNDSEGTLPSDSDLIEIVSAMREVFPKGAKPKDDGTTSNWMWRGNTKDLVRALKSFITDYGIYTKEDFVKAAEKYVRSFNGDYRKMRILKYFIVKNEHKTREDGTGYIERVSELANILENLDDENIDTNWDTEMR